MTVTGARLYLAAQEANLDLKPRIRVLGGCKFPGVDCRVDGWVGACTVSFLMGSTQHQDVLPSLDEALLVAGLLTSPIVGASKIQVQKSGAARGGGYSSVYSSVHDWGRDRLGKNVLGEVLGWWSL